MKKAILIICLWFSYGLNAQEFTCGTADPDPDEYLAGLKAMAAYAKKKNPTLKKAEGMRYVAINPIMYRRTDGTGALGLDKLNTGLYYLNKDYKDANIEFYILGAEADLTYVTDNDFVDGNYSSAQHSTYQSTYGVTNAINAHFVKSTNSGSAGYAPIRPGSQALNWIVMDNDETASEKTFPHELGHYFNLLHTFQYSSAGDISKRELVTRLDVETEGRLPANCSSTGDFICDTPADPYDRVGLDGITNCVYTSDVVDANGDLYTPLVRNIMDYYWCSGMTFTPGQHTMISNAYDFFMRDGAQFNFSAPVTNQSAPENVAGALLSEASNIGITVTWSDVSTVETGYLIERATAIDGNYTAIGGVPPNTETFTDKKTEAGTTYYYRVKPSNNPNAVSVTEGVTTPETCGIVVGSVCQNMYYIQVFYVYELNDGDRIINHVANECSENSYSDFYNTIEPTKNLIAGKTYTFRERQIFTSGGNHITQYCAVFIDYNGDNDFDDENEAIYQSSEKEANVIKPFTIPTTVANQEVRLRVITSDSKINNACSNIARGEYEDYKVILQNDALGLGDTLTATDLQLYPNPNDGKTIYLKGNRVNEVKAVKLYSVSGQKVDVALHRVGDAIEIVASGELAPGVYIMAITTNAGTLQKKLVVK